MTFMPVSQPLLSPCVGVCTLDESDHCIGCQRSADEIARWGQFSDAERDAIMRELPHRAPSAGSG